MKRDYCAVSLPKQTDSSGGGDVLRKDAHWAAASSWQSSARIPAPAQPPQPLTGNL